MKITVSFPFQEHWEGEWRLGAAAFHTAECDVRPVLVKAKFPAAAGDHRSATVCLHLTVGKDGAPRDIQIPSPQDTRLDKEAIAIVGDWRFRPGTKNKQPVDVAATFTLVHGASNGVVASGHLRP